MEIVGQILSHHADQMLNALFEFECVESIERILMKSLYIKLSPRSQKSVADAMDGRLSKPVFHECLRCHAAMYFYAKANQALGQEELS